MDATFWLLLGAIVVYSCAFLVAGVKVRRKIAMFQQEIDQARAQVVGVANTGMENIQKRVIAWAFTESQGEIDDPANPGAKKKVLIRTPSPAFRELVALLMPELIGQGMQWAKKNVKMGDVVGLAAGGGGGGLGAAITPETLKQMGIPKEWRGIAAIGFQFKDQILGFLGGKRGATAGADGSASSTHTNPFLGK
jgi:hypothetical protein